MSTSCGLPQPLVIRHGVLAALLVLSLAWGQSSAVMANQAETTAVAAKVKEIFRTRCLECHGGSAVQGGVDILKAAEMRDLGMVVAGEPDESQLYLVLIAEDDDVRMPQGLPPLTADEMETIRKWIVAGAIDFPADVASPGGAKTSAVAANSSTPVQDKPVGNAEYVLEQILKHQRSLPDHERLHVRYFSSHHLLVSGTTTQELQRQRDALFKAINHLSRQPDMVHPEVLNPEFGTLFAVDLRKLGWHRAVATAPGSEEGTDTLSIHDLLLLEYPYSIIYEDSRTWDALAREYLTPSGMVRPIPYVRTDWFSSVATLPPLYHDILQLPRTVAELEEQLNIDCADNIEQRIAKRAGMAVSGVSRNNRAVERHPAADGAYWKSVDYASSKGSENIFIDPMHLRGTGGEMIFNLPNGLQAYYIADAAGARLDFAPTSIVTDKFAEDKTVRNGLSCIRCHDRGIKRFRDQVRPAIERINASGLIDKRATLELYPPTEEMAKLVAADEKRFLDALEKALGHPQTEEPLIPVSHRFLEAPLPLTAVSGELGLVSTDDLRVIVRQPQLTGLGLVALADAGVVRRDTWEDYYDQVITALGVGVPIVAIDGLTRPDYLPVTSKLDVRISTTKKNNIFAPGDELAILVENKGNVPVFVELLGRSPAGDVVSVVPAGTEIAARETLRFPTSGALKVKPILGREEIILYASEKKFAPAKIYRGENLADRIVHPYYDVDPDRETPIENDARVMIKRTLSIETR